jgi:biopolymer transport protein ExbD
MLIRAAGPEPAPGIDLTPVIDTVFNLLIFFLVATTFHQSEREMRIALPHSTTAGPISLSLRELVVNVDAEGRIVVGGRVMSPESLRALVREAVAQNPEQKVTIRGDRSAAYAHIVAALDICKSEGIQQPYLDTLAGREAE